jgi:HTH-type transcriptional regulator/antitoxin HipB
MTELARSPEQIGNAIRRARKKRGMSQAELGEKTGLRQGTISLIEKGHAAAKLETILVVLTVLNLELQIAPRSGLAGALLRGLENHGKK